MILQKLASAIRRQDWFQVVIEVLIVIVGIFLGLQVQEWNVDRLEKLEEREYLQRLTIELGETIQFNENVISELENSHNKLPIIMQLINSQELNRTTMPVFEENFAATTYIPHPILQSSAITEMIATGKVAIINSIIVKKEIIKYNNAIINQQNNINGQFAEFLSVRNEINEQVRLSHDYWDSKKVLDSPEDITKNKVLIGKISFINEFQAKQLEQISEFHIHTKNLKSLLMKHLENS